MAMAYPSFEEWKESLSPEVRARVEQQIAELRQLGDHEPEQTVRSEVSENFPQRAKFLFLRKLWSDAIEPWRLHVTNWVKQHMNSEKEDPGGYFADAGAAIHRMKAAGISDEDLASLARMVAYETAFSIAYALDYGCDDKAKHMPGWCLYETDPSGNSTGRDMSALHESILSADPSGLEGRVR